MQVSKPSKCSLDKRDLPLNRCSRLSVSRIAGTTTCMGWVGAARRDNCRCDEENAAREAQFRRRSKAKALRGSRKRLQSSFKRHRTKQTADPRPSAAERDQE